MTRYSGSQASLDDGRDLATCSISEDVHLRYLRDLRAPCVDGWYCDAFVSLCLRVCDVNGRTGGALLRGVVNGAAAGGTGAGGASEAVPAGDDFSALETNRIEVGDSR